MDNQGFRGTVARWGQWLAGSKPPRVACEIAADGVSAARRARGSQRIEAWATKPLPDGVVRPGPLAENVLDAGALGQALEGVLSEVAGGEKRVAAILPDQAARVWLLPLDDLPARPAEAEALLRWRLAREVTFDLEQALLSYQVFPRGETGKGVLVSAIQRAFVRQYEERFEALGLEPVWVTLATLATLGWSDPEPPSQLLVRRDPGSLGLAIVQGRELRFLRSVPASFADGSAEALFEQIYPSLVYFQDQWGEAVTRALLVGVGEARAELARMLRQEAGCTASELELEAWLGEIHPTARLSERAHSLAAPLGFLRAGAQP